MTEPAPSAGHLPGVGDLVSHYRIVAEIGRGGMGVVFRAVDLGLDREVALKCMRPDLSGREEHRRRFLRESKAASRVSHPNVVSVFEVFEHQDLPWIAMELVHGTSLHQLLKSGGPLPVPQVLRHAEELADALRVAHSRHILHRDVNPNNVLVGLDGRCRLMDFGLAQFWSSEEEGSLVSSLISTSTAPGKLMGTPGYMAPEQLLGEPADARSDLFALGAVLYEMCTGRTAFPKTSPGALVDAVLNRDPAPPSRLSPDVPWELERVIRKAMAKRPDERYQGAADFAADIRALRRKLESGNQPPEPVIPRRKRRTRLGRVAIAALAGGAAVAAVGVWRARGWLERPPAWTGAPRQLTSAPGWEGEPQLSPDGGLITYASDEAGSPDIWLIDARGGRPLRLTDDPATDRNPVWFPDSSAIAFASDRGGSTSVWKVPRLGGAPSMVVHDASEPTISPDGATLAFTRRDESGYQRVHLAPLADPARATRLTGERDGLWDHWHPAWSPDGRFICYHDQRDLWVVPVEGGGARKLTSEHELDEWPTWSPDGRQVYFASRRGGTTALWRVGVAGGSPERLTLGTGPETAPDISSDGRRLVYSTAVETSDIVLVDLATRTSTRLPGVRDEDQPSFAPDGTGFAFTSNRSGSNGLWWQALDQGRTAGAPLQLTEGPGSFSSPCFSPDGRWLAFHRVLDGQRDIWVMPAEGGIPLRFTDHPGVDIHPVWSADGSRIAFASDRAGSSHLFVTPSRDGRPAGPALQLTSGSREDYGPAWSPSASTIAFLSHAGNESEVWLVDADGSSPPRPLTRGAHADGVAWDRASGELLVSGTWGTPQIEVRRVALADGEARALVPPLVIGRSGSSPSFTLSGDGRMIAYSHREARGDLWVLVRNDD